ncbi:hypothetical protein HPB51_002938 [Rhipicephalus microplus]|uniref:Uncharacterized protein n=1 Tax=Rhipicephalus microplus TaxID=6941 RepID=A0A9J6DT63_RHIMP|nr:hypothetical protein HPB51_002938 [Rhipicephalus microplus]
MIAPLEDGKRHKLIEVDASTLHSSMKSLKRMTLQASTNSGDVRLSPEASTARDASSTTGARSRRGNVLHMTVASSQRRRRQALPRGLRFPPARLHMRARLKRSRCCCYYTLAYRFSVAPLPKSAKTPPVATDFRFAAPVSSFLRHFPVEKKKETGDSCSRTTAGRPAARRECLPVSPYIRRGVARGSVLYLAAADWTRALLHHLPRSCPREVAFRVHSQLRL